MIFLKPGPFQLIEDIQLAYVSEKGWMDGHCTVHTDFLAELKKKKCYHISMFVTCKNSNHN